MDLLVVGKNSSSSRIMSILRLIIFVQLSTFALACSIITFQPRFSDPFLRSLRAATFGSFAFSSIIPVIHGIAKYGWALQSQRMGLRWVFVTLGLNTIGAAAYAIKRCCYNLFFPASTSFRHSFKTVRNGLTVGTSK